jgi:Domain of unknown function (DUF6378)
MNPKDSVQQESINLCYPGGDRHETYGNPVDAFKRHAKIYNAIKPKHLPELDALGIDYVMLAVKLSRESGKHKRDNLVDGVSYMDFIDQIYEDMKGEKQPAIRDEQPKKVEAEQGEETIAEGSKVLVFDRYRFAKPLLAEVVSFSYSNDGVEVELLQSNSARYPIGCSVWVHLSQLRIAT